MTDLPTYECHVAGVEHELVSDHTRIMRTGDHAFIIACDCGPTPLDEADTPPHDDPDQFVNLDGRAPSAEQWLVLDRAAEGWYATTAFETPEPDQFKRTNGERRAELRDKIAEIADADDGRSLEPSEREVTARGVECPDCGVSAGSKCQRPSGHTVRSVHADRVGAAVASGVIDAETEAVEQASLSSWKRG